MNTKKLLSLGWITSISFILGTFILGGQLEGYSAISQTVSEIGALGSPLYVHFQIFTLMIGFLLMLFAIGIILFARSYGLSVLPGVLIIITGLAELGIGVFASPHPLHNVFGLLLLVGYFSPLMYYLLWKNRLGITFKRFSLYAFILIMLGVFLNLTPLFNPTLYPLEYYGIMQRFLLFTFYLYCAFISISTINSSLTLQEHTEHKKE